MELCMRHIPATAAAHKGENELMTQDLNTKVGHSNSKYQ